MLKEKIFRGVLAVQTDWGVRYVRPSLVERIRLLWTFRNFHLLPEEVLHRHERALIRSLYRRGKFLVNWNGHGDLAVYCIGTIERSVPRQQPSSTMLKPATHAQQPSNLVPRAS
jgi:hypothetical protein